MKSSRYRFFAYAGSFILIALIVILVLLKVDDWKEMKIELIKDLIQLSLIVIIGGILVHEYTLDREKEKKQNDLKKELYLSMSESYFKVKKIRRVLEARVKNKNEPANRKMLYAAYEPQIQELNEAQLEYESHKKKIAFFLKANGFRDMEIGRNLKGNLAKMESYLNDIVEEYQGIEPGRDEINISSETKKMNAFIFNTNDFKDGFSHCHRDNNNLFLSELLNVKPVPTDDNE